MKKILTVSLFAMMAVSAANADIASTAYVTQRTGNTTFTGSVQNSADLTAAVNTLAGKVDTVVGSGSGSVSEQINSALEDYTNTDDMEAAIATAKSEAIADAATAAEQYINQAELDASQNAQNTTLKAYADTQATAAKNAAIAAIPAVDTTFNAESGNAATSKAIAGYVDSVRQELSNTNAAALGELEDMFDDYTTTTAMNTLIETAKSEAITAAQGNTDTALAAAKAYADAEDKKIEDTIGTVAEGKTVVQMINDAASNASTTLNNTLQNYSTTSQMNTAIDTAKTAAITAAATAAEKYIDETELTNSQNTQTTSLQNYADGKAATAKSEAIAAAKTAGDAAYAAKSYEAIVDADKAFREQIASGTIGSDGTYALTATVANNTVSGYKWELIGR